MDKRAVEIEIKKLENEFDNLWLSKTGRFPINDREMDLYNTEKQRFIAASLEKKITPRHPFGSPKSTAAPQKDTPRMPIAAAAMSAPPGTATTSFSEFLDSLKQSFGGGPFSAGPANILMTFNPFNRIYENAKNFLANRFKSTPIEKQPAAQSASIQIPTAPLSTQQSVSGSAVIPLAMPAINNYMPDFDAERARIAELINKGIIFPTNQAASEMYEALQKATDAYSEQTGAPPNLLEFYRQQMAQLQRPERDLFRLGPQDRGDLLLRLGLGVLSRNQGSFARALGEAGKETLDFADKKLEQRYADAVAKYADALARISSEVNLSATDYKNRVDAAQRAYEKVVNLANAAAQKATAGTAGAGKLVDLDLKVLDKKSDWAKEQYKAALDFAKLRALSATKSSGSNQEEGMTASEFLQAASRLIKLAEQYEQMAGTKEEMERNRHLANELRKQATIYAMAARKAMGLSTPLNAFTGGK